MGERCVPGVAPRLRREWRATAVTATERGTTTERGTAGAVGERFISDRERARRAICILIFSALTISYYIKLNATALNACP